jgi:hypothetical protein
MITSGTKGSPRGAYTPGGALVPEVIIRHWVDASVGEPLVPEVIIRHWVDASVGEPLVLEVIIRHWVDASLGEPLVLMVHQERHRPSGG